jgi:hypothetical protein
MQVQVQTNVYFCSVYLGQRAGTKLAVSAENCGNECNLVASRARKEKYHLQQNPQTP